MIPLKRLRTTDKIHQNFTGQRRVDLNLALLEKKRGGQLEAGGDKKWDSSIWKQAKSQLLAESSGKCSYCDTPTSVIAYGDVEHFRPKSVYWWLAYSYENYLVSCVVCNQRFKKDFFPILDTSQRWEGPTVKSDTSDAALETLASEITVDPCDAENKSVGMTLTEFLRLTDKEYALIVNPYFEDPAEYLAYKPILETKEVVVVPTKESYKNIVVACEEYFGINRKELLDYRFQQYLKYITFRRLLSDGGLTGGLKTATKNRLTEMSSDRSAYAGMIRFFDKQSLDDLPWDPNLFII